MAFLELIEQCTSEYNDNLLPTISTFEDNVTINHSGDGAVTQASTRSFEGNRSIEMFTNVDPVNATFCNFDFGDALETTVNRTGTYILSLRLLNGTTFATDFDTKFKVYVYVNTVLFTSLDIDILTLSPDNKDIWRTFSQVINLTSGDVINYTFEFDTNPQPEINPNAYLYMDGLKLEFDNKSLGLPSIYTLPNQRLLPEAFVFVTDKSDLPTPVGGVISLKAGVIYTILNEVDLLGDRIFMEDGSILRGLSSHNALLRSTGKVSGALLSSTSDVDLSNMSIADDSEVFDLNGNGTTDNCFLNGLTISNCASLGSIQNYAAILMNESTFNNNGTLDFDGTIGTIGANTSLFIPASGATAINVLSTATITRRIRMLYSGWVINGSAVGINLNASATIADESYLLDSNSFTGTSVNYLLGVTQTSNKALFVANKGLENTFVNGQMYMQNNAVATVIGATNTWTKLAGVTTASADNAKYLHSDNRLTCDAVIERKYLISCANLNYSAGNNNVCKFGFYDSKLGAVRVPSQTESTTSGVGVAEQVAFQCVVSHSQGDYIEIWGQNNTAITNITAKNLNVIITQIG